MEIKNTVTFFAFLILIFIVLALLSFKNSLAANLIMASSPLIALIGYFVVEKRAEYREELESRNMIIHESEACLQRFFVTFKQFNHRGEETFHCLQGPTSIFFTSKISNDQVIK